MLVLVQYGDVLVVDGEDAPAVDVHAMGVAREVLLGAVRPDYWRLGIDDSLLDDALGIDRLGDFLNGGTWLGSSLPVLSRGR